MPPHPRFSLVLPTIGRVEYLRDAIASVHRQSFTNFELIISDNSNDGRVKPIADEYRDDNRVRYIRPVERLNMPDHWEFAALHANGEFVSILQDRVVMVPNALLTVQREIALVGPEPEVVYWPHVSNYDHRTGRVSRVDCYTGFSEMKNPRALVAAFARFEIPRTHMPHSSNSFCHRDLARTIRNRHERLFMPLTPDDASGFLELAYANRVLFVDQPLWIGRLTARSNSNGTNAQLGGTRSYAASVGLPDYLREVPLPIDTVLNCIIYDLLQIKRIVDPLLESVELDLEKYAIAIYGEILEKDLSGSGLDTASMYQEWKEFVDGLPAQARTTIERQAATFRGGRHWVVGQFKRVSSRMGLQPSLSFLKAKLGAWDRTVWSDVRYDTILDAASSLAVSGSPRPIEGMVALSAR